MRLIPMIMPGVACAPLCPLDRGYEALDEWGTRTAGPGSAHRLGAQPIRQSQRLPGFLLSCHGGVPAPYYAYPAMPGMPAQAPYYYYVVPQTAAPGGYGWPANCSGMPAMTNGVGPASFAPPMQAAWPGAAQPVGMYSSGLTVSAQQAEIPPQQSDLASPPTVIMSSATNAGPASPTCCDPVSRFRGRRCASGRTSHHDGLAVLQVRHDGSSSGRDCPPCRMPDDGQARDRALRIDELQLPQGTNGRIQ
jgi:hypothetical protein